MAYRFVLNQVLDSNGMTQEQLSEATGVSLETIASMNDGSALDFSLKELESICESLRCGPSDIIKNFKGDWHIINPKTGAQMPTNSIDF